MDIKCERDIAKEISDFFTFNVPGAEYTPAFKYKKWDGKIRLFNMFKRSLYVGLLEYLIKFCEDRRYDYNIDPYLIPHPKIIKQNHVKDFFDNTAF